MAAAHCAVRPIRKVLVWGRSTERASILASELAGSGLPAEPVARLAEGIKEADIVTCATTSREAIVLGDHVAAGTHVDLVGAFTPDMRECDDALIKKSAVFVDTFAGALKEAGDLVHLLNSGAIPRSHIRAELYDLVSGRHSGRTHQDEITLFKSVGTALEDLCAARLVFDRLAG
jgi:ornithine cyclodeaminase